MHKVLKQNIGLLVCEAQPVVGRLEPRGGTFGGGGGGCGEVTRVDDDGGEAAEVGGTVDV